MPTISYLYNNLKGSEDITLQIVLFVIAVILLVGTIYLGYKAYKELK